VKVAVPDPAAFANSQLDRVIVNGGGMRMTDRRAGGGMPGLILSAGVAC